MSPALAGDGASASAVGPASRPPQPDPQAAGPLNYFGANPETPCTAPQPSPVSTAFTGRGMTRRAVVQVSCHEHTMKGLA
jgi:hypothetical protein